MVAGVEVFVRAGSRGKRGIGRSSVDPKRAVACSETSGRDTARASELSEETRYGGLRLRGEPGTVRRQLHRETGFVRWHGLDPCVSRPVCVRPPPESRPANCPARVGRAENRRAIQSRWREPSLKITREKRRRQVCRRRHRTRRECRPSLHHGRGRAFEAGDIVLLVEGTSVFCGKRQTKCPAHA